MKKIICLIVCIIFLIVLTSCGSKLPKGEASYISFVKGGMVSDVTFKYVNESLVKIVTDDDQVIYVPNSNISEIVVK